MISITKYKVRHDLAFRPDDIFPVVIQGVEAYDVLCPVSKFTGHRENPLKLLRSLTLDPARSRALEMFMQEIPTIASDPRLSDTDRVSLMMDRLSTGTPSEDERYRQMLEQVVEPLFAKQSDTDISSDKTIRFDADSAPDVSNVSSPSD